MRQLCSVVDTQFEFVHICDLLKSGVPDKEWVPSLAGNLWVIITSDAGKHSVKNDKLPSLCRQHELTHIVFGSTLHSQKAIKKLEVLVNLWMDIESTINEIAGTRFKIRCSKKNGDGERFYLKKDSA